MILNTKLPLLTIGFVAIMFLSACQPVASPLLGMIYNETKYGDMVTSHDAGTKEGKSCANSVLGIVATGDASIQAAKNNVDGVSAFSWDNRRSAAEVSLGRRIVSVTSLSSVPR